MKKMYWHTHNLPRIFIVLLCLMTLLGMFVVEHFKKFVPVENYTLKVDAAHLTRDAFKAAKDFRRAQHIPINNSLDPQASGLIGDNLTEITSDGGNIITKRTTINPNIVAIFINWLDQLHLQPGDTVAIGATGSFPALDISMLAAIKSLQLKPLIIYSAAASQFGANIPGFTFIDIQHDLKQKGLFNYEPLAISLGGGQDIASRMSDKGRAILTDTINQYHYPLLSPTGTIDSVTQRMAIYKNAAHNQPISAYINVGGGMASIGLKQLEHKKIKSIDKPHSLPSGVIMELPISLANTDSVAVRFLKEGVPVVNVHNIGAKLRNQYNLPVDARYSIIGWGKLFFHETYNEWLTGIVLLAILAVLITMAVLSRKHRIRYIPPR